MTTQPKKKKKENLNKYKQQTDKTTWMNLKNMLSEGSMSKKRTHYMNLKGDSSVGKF